MKSHHETSIQVRESFYTPRSSHDGKAKIQDFLKRLLKETRAHASAWPFQEPVRADEVPDYYRYVCVCVCAGMWKVDVAFGA